MSILLRVVVRQAAGQRCDLPFASNTVITFFNANTGCIVYWVSTCSIANRKDYVSGVLKEKHQLTFLLRDICSIEISYSVSIGVRLEFIHKSIAVEKKVLILTLFLWE